MEKGVSIFYEFHDQGCPHVIAGIYSPRTYTEEEMRTKLLALLGYEEFNERDQPTYINHTHLYAHYLLGKEIDKDTRYILSRFFPEALEPQTLPVDPMKFEHRDVGAYDFIWDNRYRKELREYRTALIKEGVERYKEERARRKGNE